jgi:signal peptidase II
MNRVPANRYLIFLLITVGGTALDLWSKTAVFAKYGVRKGSGWFIDSWLKFEFHTTFNEGALWGIGQGFAWLFAILSVVAFLGVIYWLFVAKAARSLWLTVTLGLVTAGTLGNLYDRLALHGWTHPDTGKPYQAVRDFFRFRFGEFEWATFNVADIFLVVGAIMLVIQSLFHEPIPGENEQQQLATAQSNSA